MMQKVGWRAFLFPSSIYKMEVEFITHSHSTYSSLEAKVALKQWQSQCAHKNLWRLPNIDTETYEEISSPSASFRTDCIYPHHLSTPKKEYLEDRWYENLEKVRGLNGKPIDSKLKNWIHNQKNRYRHNLLSPERINALKTLNFDFATKTSSWNTKFEQLLRFRQVHGHCKVPVTGEQNKKLNM
jgi:hypothetical protein